MKRFAAVFAVVLAACTPRASVLNRLSLGMSKADVLKIAGSPVSVSATEGTEYLNYRFFERHNDAFAMPYFVRLRGGKVDAYGRTGDFDSTKDAAINLNVKR